MSSAAQRDFLIVGAGVVGLSIAWQLAKHGAKVTLIDSGDVGRAASWAGAGILPPARFEAGGHPVEKLRGLANHLHPQWSMQLKEVTGVDNGYRKCGGLHLARTIGEEASLLGLAALFADEGIPCVARSAAECQSAELNLEPDPELKVGYWVPDEAQIRNPRHLRALSEACLTNGVTLLEHEPVEAWEVNDRRIAAVVTKKRKLTAEVVCLTAGAWTVRLLEMLGISNGLLPVRGQMVLFRTPTPLLGCIVNEGSRYLVPREDGRLLVGSTEEEVGFDCQTTPNAIEDLVDFAYSLVPKLKQSSIEATWAGLRPATFDGLPYMGRLPGLDNGFVSAGHFRSGLSLSPAIAEVMTKLMNHENTVIDLAPFRVDREWSQQVC